MLACLAGLAGCVPPPPVPPSSAAGTQPNPAIADAPWPDNAPASLQALAAAPPTGAAATIEPGPVLRLVFPERAFFDFDADTPRPDSLATLHALAAAIATALGGRAAITIVGHTDAIGTAGYNVDLSRRRARAVAALLAADGVAQGALSLAAAGALQPIARNDTPAGRALNRRVEFVVSADLGTNLAAIRRFAVDAALLDRDRLGHTRRIDIYPATGDRPDQVLALDDPTPLAAEPPPPPTRASPAVPRPRHPVSQPTPRLTTPDPVHLRDLEPD